MWQDFPCISDVATIQAEDKRNFVRECGSCYLHISTHIYTYLQQYLHRYSSWMEQLGGHPSIVLWVVFNEAWGQHDTETVTR